MGIQRADFSALIQFLVPWARLGRARSEAYDVESCKKLWEWLEEQVITE